ncbi:MAG: hypothetical protein IJP45_09105 [Paludibacteraceae bacterium]|nr:hypothetical protein [Paludibacteraceae bacterium]
MTWAERDLDRHLSEEEAWLSRLPVCDVCGEPIQSEYMYEYNGDKICEDCMECCKVSVEPEEE